LCLDFTVTRSSLGTHWVTNLKPGGEDIPVTGDNLIEYTELQLRERLFGSSRLQLAHLLRGVYEVVPQSLLAAFTFQELELLLIGQPNIDVENWRAHTEYRGEYSDTHEVGDAYTDPHTALSHILTHTLSHILQVIGWFWEVIEDLSEEDRAKLLQFTTGTSRVPAQVACGLL
jgi:hypothetical protein